MAEPAKSKWRGYSLDELRYHKALTLVRMEVQKERILATKQEAMTTAVPHNFIGAIWRKFTANPSIAKYAMMGLKAFSIGRTIYGFFHRRKR